MSERPSPLKSPAIHEMLSLHPPLLLTQTWGSSNVASFDGYTEMSVGAPADWLSGHMVARSYAFRGAAPSGAEPSGFGISMFPPSVSDVPPCDEELEQPTPLVRT